MLSRLFLKNVQFFVKPIRTHVDDDDEHNTIKALLSKTPKTNQTRCDSTDARLKNPFTFEIAQELGGEKFFRNLAQMGGKAGCPTKVLSLIKALAQDISIEKTGIQYEMNFVHTLGSTSCQQVLDAIRNVEENANYIINANIANAVSAELIKSSYSETLTLIPDVKVKLAKSIER